MADRADKVTSIKSKETEEQSTEEEPKATSGPRAPRRRRRFGLIISILVVIAAGYFGFQEFQARMTHVFEQDARIAGNLITVSSRVSGWVTDLQVRESQHVRKGAVLVRIDDRESHLAAERLNAQLGGIKAEQAQLNAERELAQSQISSRINTRKSEVNAANAAIESLRPQLELAQSEYRRAKSLFSKKVIPKRELDQRRATMQRLEGDLRTAAAKRESSENQLREARAAAAQLKVLDSQIAVLDHKRAEIDALYRSRTLDLADRTIRAPVDSVIDRTFVEVGEFVSPGQRLVLVHDPKEVWVEANIKETEIRRLKLGQPVDIHVDAYPDREFTGKVLSIGNAATSEFALLPSPNPSGNFTKTTQRLRTMIAVEQQEGLLRPGMMVEVSIAVK